MDDAVSRQWRRDKPVPGNIAANSTDRPSSRTTIFVIVPTNVPSNTHRNLARRFIDSLQPQWFQFTGFWSIGFWLRNREKNSGAGCWICKLLVSFLSVLLNCFFLFFIEHSKRCARYISAVWIFAIFKDRAGKIWWIHFCQIVSFYATYCGWKKKYSILQYETDEKERKYLFWWIPVVSWHF